MVPHSSGFASGYAIKVYNVLGNVIATLVNEEKHIGNYKVDFYASKLASGIYFYRMHASTSSAYNASTSSAQVPSTGSTRLRQAQSDSSPSNSAGDFVETKKLILMK